MNWVEQWAKLKVIGMWVGLGIISLIVLAVVVCISVYFIKQTYKKHSKKYVWDCIRNDYVRKEDFYK